MWSSSGAERISRLKGITACAGLGVTTYTDDVSATIIKADEETRAEAARTSSGKKAQDADYIEKLLPEQLRYLDKRCIFLDLDRKRFDLWHA